MTDQQIVNNLIIGDHRKDFFFVLANLLDFRQGCEDLCVINVMIKVFRDRINELNIDTDNYSKELN